MPNKEKTYTIKSEDPDIHMEDILLYYASAKYQGTFKGYQLKTGGSNGLGVVKIYWYAIKDQEVYVDRGLTGLLDYIESKQLQLKET